MRLSSYPHLAKLRIGCVQYLNAKPLIFGYKGAVLFEHPSRLATLLSEGRLDVALVPTYELMRAPVYDVVDEISISAIGAVFSVFLAYKGDINAIKTVSLDTASLTSVNLVRCILAEFYNLSPAYVSPAICKDENAARLLIGNQAIDFRREHGDAYQYLDLGEEWTRQTSLPFVFAVWLIRKDVAEAPAAADELRELKRYGLAHIPDIVRKEKRYDAEFEAKYLTQYIRYDLGDAEKGGIEKFRDLLIKHSLILEQKTPLTFL